MPRKKPKHKPTLPDIERMLADGMSHQDIVEYYGMSKAWLIDRIRELGMPKVVPAPKTINIERLRELAGKQIGIAVIAVMLKARTVDVRAAAVAAGISIATGKNIRPATAPTNEELRKMNAACRHDAQIGATGYGWTSPLGWE